MSAARGAREQVTRLLALAPYLQTHHDVRLATVAEDFGVSPQQILKDLNVLFLCGLPGLTPDVMIEVNVEALEEDPAGVVRIDNAEFLARPVALGSSEASALIVALRALREGSPTASAEVIDKTLEKLEQATVGSVPPVEVHLPGRSTTAQTADQLREAIAADRQVRLDYYVPTRDESTQRVVDPLEVHTTEGVDYLDAWCHRADDRRWFRVDRVHEAEVLDTPRQRLDLEPREPAESLFEPAPGALEAVLELEPEVRWLAEHHRFTEVVEAGEGRLRVHLLVADPRWLLQLALRFAPAVRILEPDDLAAELVDTARSRLALQRAAQQPTDAQDRGVR